MQHRQTLIMALATVGIITAVAVVGFLQSQTQTGPAPQTNRDAAADQPTERKPLKRAELDALLEKELTTISLAFAAQYPQAATLYAIDRGKLHLTGEWYTTTLTYQGDDAANRDTLRVLMQKKNGEWVLRSTPPEPLLTQPDYPDVPKEILRDINKPTLLPGTDTSPEITLD